MAPRAAAAALLDCLGSCTSPPYPLDPAVRWSLEGFIGTGKMPVASSDHVSRIQKALDFLTRKPICPESGENASHLLRSIESGKVPLVPRMSPRSDLSLALVGGREQRRALYQTLPGAARPSFLKNIILRLFRPIFSDRVHSLYWRQMSQVALHSATPLILFPLAVLTHIGAAWMTKEISWNESIDELAGIGKGSLWIGSSILAVMGTGNALFKLAREKFLGRWMIKTGAVFSPRLRSLTLAVALETLFTFIAMRKSQEHTAEENYPYLLDAGKEIGMGGLMNFVSADLALLAMARNRVRPRRAFFAAMGLGYFVSSWIASKYRRMRRQEQKEKDYAFVAQSLETLPQLGREQRAKALWELDRRFARLISQNALEAKPLPAATQSENGGVEPYKEAKKWIQEIRKKESVWGLPVTLLPAQEKRLRFLLEGELAEVDHYLRDPIPLEYGHDSNGNIPSAQFFNWGFAETMGLLHRYQKHRLEAEAL